MYRWPAEIDRMQTTRFAIGYVAVALLVGAVGACKSSDNQTKPDSGNADRSITDTPVTSDGGGSDAADSAPDGGTASDSSTATDAAIECAPLPTGGPIRAGAAPMQDAGATVASTATRPELSQATADDQYTITKALAQGGAISGPGINLPDAGTVGSVTYTLMDGWDPVTNGIGDPGTFTPMFTVASDGTGTHTTVGAAVTAAVALATCGRVYIRLMPGIYREQVTIPSKTSAPPLTIYSAESDATKTRIVFNASASQRGNMSASATLTVKALFGLQMKNLTIANDYVEDSTPGGDQSAVALLNQADRAQFENVRILGNISTLYLKSLDAVTVARSYFRDSYIEGDQDIILGRGTAVFDHTEIKYLSGRQPSGGVIGYPSTLAFNRYGFLFDSCQFTAETGASGVFLGHQWEESGFTEAVGKMLVRNSTLGAHIAAAPWSTLNNRTTTPKDPAGTLPVLVFTSDDFYATGTGPMPAEPYLAEYGNTGAGAHH
jgi:pectinesterase